LPFSQQQQQQQQQQQNRSVASIWEKGVEYKKNISIVITTQHPNWFGSDFSNNPSPDSRGARRPTFLILCTWIASQTGRD
jgi:hypothetical protein